MKLFTHLTLLPIFILFIDSTYAQEKIDTLFLQPKSNSDEKFINRNWQLSYPTLPDTYLPKSNLESNLFRGNWQLKVDPFIQTTYFPDNKFLHTYSSKTVSTYLLSDPLQFGFDFHIKPLKVSPHLNLYFIGNGSLLNQNIFTPFQPGQPPPEGRALFLESKAGIEYEFTDHWSAFFEYSLGFGNKTFLGTRKNAGLRYKF